MESGASPALPWLRTARTALIAGLGVGLGGVTHAHAGAAAPATLALLLALATTAPLVWVLAARRLRLGALVGLLALAQVLAHTAFVLVARTAAVGPAASAPHGTHVSSPLLHSVGPTAWAPSPLMVLGHLLAALVIGWLLTSGEALLWRVVAALLPSRPDSPAITTATPFAVANVVVLRDLRRHATCRGRAPPLAAR